MMRVHLVDGVVCAVKEELVFFCFCFLQHLCVKRNSDRRIFSSQPSHRPASWHTSGRGYWLQLTESQCTFFFINSSIGSAFFSVYYYYYYFLGRILLCIFLSSVSFYSLQVFVKIFIHTLKRSASTYRLLSKCNT